MTRVYLIRHAEAEGNLYRVAQGQDNSNLTDRGWRQVKALEKRFETIDVHAIYASDLYRTCATASAVYKPKGLTLHRRRDLREICVGVWEQKPWGEIARTDDGQLANFTAHPERWSVSGGEPPAQVQARVVAAAKEIAAAHEGKTVALVSHGYAIRLLLAAAQGVALENLEQTPLGDNTAVSLLEYENGTLRVVFRDDNSHLQSPEYLAGEKVRKRAVGVEAGLYFLPLSAQQAEMFAPVAESCWAESRKRDPFDWKKFAAGMEQRLTLAAYLREECVGLMQLEPENGWISLLCIRPEFRQRSFGVQLIGQAVLRTRRAGGETLQIRLEPGNPAEVFFRDYGFFPVEREAGLLRKKIGFEPEYLTTE